MAIKSSDPRKLEDLDITGSRFDRLVAEAWSTRHQSDEGLSPRGTGRIPGAADPAGERRSSISPTHHPFADLRDRLRRS